MKLIRKPIITTFTLLVVISIVYYMTSSSTNKSLGNSTPINLQKDQFNKESFNLVSQEKKLSDIINQEDEIENPEVIKRPSKNKPIKNNKQQQEQADEIIIDEGKDITETPFMPKMVNETLKAQLGNAAWKLFHTILARYPDRPSKQEQLTLSQYLKLFAQVYPCGDCARHFTKLLEKFPPQVSSRKNAALWGCDIHNKVNDRLNKEQYDCTTILEDYDCGCGSDEKEEDSTLGKESIDHIRNIKIDEIENQPQLGG